jgi:hypothetical protein
MTVTDHLTRTDGGIAPVDEGLQRRLAARLAELHEDQAGGHAALRELEERRERLVTALLRVGGAIQVLEELLGSPEE